jgi:RHS repeat-associated protein
LPKKILLPNTSYITNHYDNVARLLFTKLNNASHTTLNKHDYVLNAGNQRTKHTRADDSHLTFSYDPIGQLTIARATNSGGTIISGETKGYFYDAAWNLNYRTNTSSGSTTAFSVNSKNELTQVGSTVYTLDDNGNLTQEGEPPYPIYFVYDDENRLVAIENHYYYQPQWRTEFEYDGRGRLRVRKEYQAEAEYPYAWVLASQTRYVYDGMRVIQERNDSNTPQVSYTRGSDLSGSLEGAGGIGGLLGRSHGYSSGNWSTHNYYHADGGGNITYLVNSSQGLAASYKYDAYGNLVAYSGALAGANVYRFSSKEQHANSGLNYYGYRWYAPNLQRWLNKDPMGELGFEASRLRTARASFAKPAELHEGPNLYSFLHNDPLNYYDPYGLRPAGQDLDDCLAICDQARKDEVTQNVSKLLKKYAVVHIVLLGGTAISGCAKAPKAFAVFLVLDVVDAALTLNAAEKIKKTAVQNWIACCGGCAETPEEMKEVIKHIEETPK